MCLERREIMSVPKFDQMFNVLLEVLRDLGGSASNEELEEKVSLKLGLTESDLSAMHTPNQTRFSYNLAWTRSYLKNFGLLEIPARKVWSLNDLGKQTKVVDPKEVKRIAREVTAEKKKLKNIELQIDTVDFDPEDDVEPMSWELETLGVLKMMPPEAFERLCQYLLRRSGFVQVEVTGRTGDGGIDGKGIFKLGILSFHVFFQCKRYKDSVGSPVVRDFRGAMVGRADKGIIMTTGTFSRDAKLEALRDGATPLDLIDGDELVRMLKEHQIGIKTEQKMVELVQVNKNFFLEF